MPRPQPVPRDALGEAPFLAAIRAEPDNDLPRLVFADWLEERGDPRGEFIRLQCELERIPLTAPERDQLEAGEAVLLKRYAAEWTAAQPRLLGVAWGLPCDNRRLRQPEMHFRRGFLEGVRFTTQAAIEKYLARLAAHEGLRGVFIPRYHTRVAGVLAKCRELSQIERFILGRADATLRAILESPHCGHLHHLNLAGVTGPLGANTVQLAAESALTAELRTLGVHGSVTDETLLPLFAAGRLPALESLDLGLRGFGPGLEALTAWAATGSLARLRLQEFSLRNRNARRHSLLALLGSPAVQRLEGLALWLLDWQDVVTALASHPQRLVDLRLMPAVTPDPRRGERGEEPSRADLAPLWFSENLAGLRRLDITAPLLGDGLAADLAGSYLHELRVLDLNCGLTEAGVQQLLESPALGKLQSLRLPFGFRSGRALRERLRERFPDDHFA